MSYRPAVLDAGWNIESWRPPRGDILTAGLRVRRLCGPGPTILLLHGVGGSHRYFGAAFDVLADESCVVAADLLGFGGSPRPADARYDARDHAAAVWEALTALDVPRPIVAVGHSAGGLVALRLAADWPDAVHGVVAFAPPLYLDATDARRYIARLAVYVKHLALDGALANVFCHWRCRYPEIAALVLQRLRPDLPPEIASDALLHSWESYSRTLRNLVFAGDAGIHLARVDVPLLLVAGQNDPAMDLALLAELGAYRARTRLDVWHGGHDLVMTHPERCAREIQSFARSLVRRPTARIAPLPRAHEPAEAGAARA